MGHEMAFAIANTASLSAAFDHLIEDHEEQNGNRHSVSTWNWDSAPKAPKMTRRMAEERLHGYYRTNLATNRYDTVAAPLYDESTLRRRKVTIKVDLTEAQYHNYDQRAAALKAAAAQVPLRNGEFLETQTLASKEGTREPDIKATTKVVQTATSGNAVTKYFVHREDASPLKDGWDKGFATQAEARAEAAARLQRGIAQGRTDNVNLEVTPVKRRENGEPLVRVSRVTSKISAKVVVTLVKSTNPDAHGGWAVAADCHH